MLASDPPGGSSTGKDSSLAANTGISIVTDINPSLLEQLKNVGKALEDSTKNFGTTLNNSWNEMNKAVTQMAFSFNNSRAFADDVRQSIKGATASVTALGGSMQDVINIQQGVMKGLGTQTIMTEDSYAGLFAAMTMANDGIKPTKEATETIVKNFTNAGISLYNISGQINTVLNQAKSIGVDAAKTFDQIEVNIKSLNLFNFQNGIEGMGKMAAHAVNMRVNIQETLNFADKLFDPQKAVEMSATFQRLGVNVTNLLDPYKLMDMARNDPEELQRSIEEAMKSLTYFDETSKSVRILPRAQGLFRQLKNELQVSDEYLINMAINGETLARKMREITFPEFAVDEKTQTFLANMATLGTGENENRYVINVEGKEKAIEDLTKPEIEKLRAKVQTAEKPAESMVDAQKASVHHLKQMEDYLKAIKETLPNALAASSSFNQVMDMLGKAGLTAFKTGGKAIGVQEKTTKTGDKIVSTEGTEKRFEDLLKGTVTDLIKARETGENMGDVFGRFMGRVGNIVDPNAFKGMKLKDFVDPDDVLKLKNTFFSDQPSNNQVTPTPTQQGNVVPQTGGVSPPSNIPGLELNSRSQTIPNEVMLKFDPNSPIVLNIVIDSPGLEDYLTEDKINRSPIIDNLTAKIQQVLNQQLIIR